MSKILWYGDACSNTGFARVTHSILDHLSKEHEIVSFGINYQGDPHSYPFKIYPASAHNPQDRFGIGRIQQIVEIERPDYIICLNDLWIVNQVWERVHLLKDQFKFKFIVNYFILLVKISFYLPTILLYYPASLIRKNSLSQ